MADTFEELLVESAPAPLLADAGEEYVRVLGQAMDDENARQKAAVKQGLIFRAEEPALADIARERLLDRTAGDTLATLQDRAWRAWELHRYDGSPESILRALATLGYNATNGNPTLVQQNGQYHQLDANGDLVVGLLGPNPPVGGNMPLAAGVTEWFSFDPTGLDANGDQYNSRFGLIFPVAPAGWTTPTDPPVVAPSLVDVNAIRRMVNRHRDGCRRFMWITVCTSGDLWDWPVDKWDAAPELWDVPPVVSVTWGPEET